MSEAMPEGEETKTKPSARSVQVLLQETYPAAFDPRVASPIRIGIHHELKQRHPGIPRKVLNAALFHWCGGQRYLRSVLARRPRVDLDGQASGEIMDQHVAHATMRLVNANGHVLPDSPSPDLLRAAAIAFVPMDTVDLSGQDLAFMMGVLQRHPAAEAKIRGLRGIRAIVHRKRFRFFAVVREGGRIETFSLAKCLGEGWSPSRPASGQPAAA